MANERRRMREALLDVAAIQQGYFTAREAGRVGYSHQAQKYHVDHGDWERVDHGIFRLRGWPRSDDDHLVRWQMWSGGLAIASHETALVLHNLGDVNPARVHLTVPHGFRKRSDSVVLHRDDVPETDVQQGEGFRMTRAARAIAETAAGGLERGLVAGAVAEALDSGATTRGRLREVAARLHVSDEIDAAIAEARR